MNRPTITAAAALVAVTALRAMPARAVCFGASWEEIQQCEQIEEQERRIRDQERRIQELESQTDIYAPSSVW